MHTKPFNCKTTTYNRIFFFDMSYAVIITSEKNSMAVLFCLSTSRAANLSVFLSKRVNIKKKHFDFLCFCVEFFF